MKPRLLVTGGAGFIGSAFVREWGHVFDITVLDCLTYAGSLDNLAGADFEFVYGDVRNAALVDSLVAEADIVVHLAAETHVTRSIHDSRAFFETDVLGTHCVANACLNHRGTVKRLVHISTSEVYGSALGEGPMFEDHPIEPMSPYAAAKAGADRLVMSYWHTFGLPIVILRPFNNYGPFQHVEKVIPRFITSAIRGEPMTVHGTGQAARDFVHVNDTARAIAMACQASGIEGEVFNVASGEARTVQSIMTMLQRVIGHGPSVHIADRPGQVTRHCGSYLKIQQRLGWQPSTHWQMGLGATVNWYQRNPAIWSRQLWAREQVVTLRDGEKVAQ